MPPFADNRHRSKSDFDQIQRIFDPPPGITKQSPQDSALTWISIMPMLEHGADGADAAHAGSSAGNAMIIDGGSTTAGSSSGSPASSRSALTESQDQREDIGK
jgi:hypothetical protein